MLGCWLIKDSLKKIKGDLSISGQPLNVCFVPTSINDLESGLVDITMLTVNHNTKISILITNDFLVSINSKSLQVNFLNILFAYFFTPNYFKINGNPSIFIPDGFIHSVFFQRVQTECKLQGYKKLYVLSCGDKQTIDLTSCANNHYTQKVFQKINSSILSWLKDGDWSDEIYPPYLIVKDTYPFPDQAKLITLEKIIIKHTFQNRLYQGLERLFIHKSQVHGLRQEIQQLKEENTNLKSYLSSHSNNSIELLKWYHEQYEVLPVWYKRFGHIIKVFTGKRTLRSLFKDE